MDQIRDSENSRPRRSVLRRLLRWGVWLVGILLILFALQIALLAFPQLLVHNRAESGNVVIYYDGNPNEEIQQLAAEVDERMSGNGYTDSLRLGHVVLFQSHSFYSFFARLTMVTPIAQGYNLPIFGNSFVSLQRVTELARERGPQPKFSVWEGSVAHTIAHELAHQYIIERFGRGIWKKLPHWKQEGIPEYIANIAAIRADTTTSLAERIQVLFDDHLWNGARGQDWCRIHYEAELMVEYLHDVRSYSFEQIMADSVSEQETLTSMIGWLNQQ